MKKNRVLLIEDNPGDARLLQAMLAEVERTRFDLECAGQLSTGLERLTTEDFDVVLLDLLLPDSQGFDTLIIARPEDCSTFQRLPKDT